MYVYIYVCVRACAYIRRLRVCGEEAEEGTREQVCNAVARVQPDERNSLCVRARVYTGWLGTLEYMLGTI